MRTFVYKQNHSDDPNQAGVFGCFDCMGGKRNLVDENVIGIGGDGARAKRHRIGCKLTWIGLGAHKTKVPGMDGPIITFDHFLYLGPEGRLLHEIAPKLAERMYRGTSHYQKKFTKEVWAEITVLLEMAEDAPPSQFNLADFLSSDRKVCIPTKNRRRKEKRKTTVQAELFADR